MALLPLSGDVDVQQLWNLILGSFLRSGSDGQQRRPQGVEAMEEDATTGLALNIDCDVGVAPLDAILERTHPVRVSLPAVLGKHGHHEWVMHAYRRTSIEGLHASVGLQMCLLHVTCQLFAGTLDSPHKLWLACRDTSHGANSGRCARQIQAALHAPPAAA